MNTQLYVTKASAMVVSASLALAMATASVASAAGRLLDSGNVAQTGVLIGGGGGPIGPSTEPDDPYSKPRTPGQPYQVESTANSAKFRWTDNSSYELGYNLYRGPGYSGPWTQIAAYGAVSGNTATMEHLDAGLPRDTGYYYRVGAYNYYGESFSLPQVFGTIDGRKVSRLRLRIRTANVPDANTDDAVHVSLRDYDNGGTWLNYGRDDFERGDEFTYELLLHDLFDGIQDLSEINHIYLLKPGDDGWCIESIALVADTTNLVDANGDVQGVELFTQDFSTTPSTCRWLDGQQNYLVIGRETLRAHPWWQAYQQPNPSTRLLRTDLEKRIEGTVGHIIHAGTYVDATPIYMGTLDVSWAVSGIVALLNDESAVKVSKKDEQAVHVEFKLDVDTPGPGGLTGSLSFDLRFTGVCRTETSPATIEMTTENADATADFDWTTEAMTLWLINLAEDDIADKIKAALPDFSQTITVDNQVVSCITPSVTEDGTVEFIPTIVARTGTGGTNTSGTGIIGGTKTTGTGVVGGTKTGGTVTRGTGTTGTETEGTIPTNLSKPTSRTFIEE